MENRNLPDLKLIESNQGKTADTSELDASKDIIRIDEEYEQPIDPEELAAAKLRHPSTPK